MEEKSLNDKVSKVLKKFVQPDFKVKNYVYLNLLLTHLTEKSSKDDADLDNNLRVSVSPEILTTWIIEATKLWTNECIVPPPFILSFALNLAAKISIDEQIFMKLSSDNTYKNLIKVVESSHNGQAIVKLGFTNLLHSFLGHNSGLHWIAGTNYWIEIVNLNMQMQTIYVKKQGYNFITCLLEKTVTLNESFCVNVVHTLVKPIKDFIASLPGDGKETPQVNNKSTYDALRPALGFLCNIMEGLISQMPANTRIFKLFMEAETWTTISKILLISHDEQFSFILLKILSLSVIFSAYEYFGQEAATSESAARDFFNLSVVSQYSDLMAGEIDKGHIFNVIQLSYQNHIYWEKASLKTHVCFRNGVAIEFEHQVMVILLLPIIVYSFSVAGETLLKHKMIEDEFRRDYVVKVLKMSGVKTLQMSCIFKQRLSSLPNITEYSICALRYLIQARQFYTQETGALVFQPLIYCLQDCLSCVSEPYQITSENCTFLDTLLEAIIVYIETFNLSWKDSIVTISVMNLAYSFLSVPETLWDTKLVIQGLKLLNTTISKYMSPNMALLMDTTEESVLSLIGPLLYTKCHNSRWEVRDSALEVIYTLTFNAKDRYPAFQKILLDAEIPQLVLQMALSDGEPFVRSTAVKCLQVSIIVPVIWEKLLSYHSDFHEKIFGILETEPEGVVRKEAATLIAKIYDEQVIPQTLLSKVYDIMTHAALADLHWEVKVNAISFWDEVIKKHLKDQGMIDGAFPNFTFSKENRKIVNLNETEIKKRLIHVLHQLSDTGCLSVFLIAIQDDCDLEVSKAATNLMKMFIELLQKYEVTISSVESTKASPSTNGDSHSHSDTKMSPSYAKDNRVNGHTPQENQPKKYMPNLESHIYSPDVAAALQISSPPSDGNDDNRSPANPVPAAEVSEQMLDDILDASDMILLQRIYNPTAQVMRNSVSMKVRSALPPQEFLEFMYGGIDSYSKEKSNWLIRLDEFGSLLDDILREYNDKSETNDMDCY